MITAGKNLPLQRNAVGAKVSEVLDTFTYFRGVLGGDWGFSAAGVGMLLGLLFGRR